MGGNDTDVELPVHDALFDGIDGGDVDVECHVGGQLIEAQDGVGDVAGRVGGGLVEHGDREIARHLVMNLIDLAAKIVEGGEQPEGRVIDVTSFIGQGKAAPAAAAEHHVQSGLQILEVAADGRAADVQLELGRRDPAGVDHRAKHPQQAHIHITQLAQKRPRGHGLFQSRLCF